MTLIRAVTTCNAAQWDAHGKKMAAGFERYWPEDVPLLFYCEGFTQPARPRVGFIDLNAAAPWLEPWKAERTDGQRGMTAQGYRFRADAARFSHKVAALDASVIAIEPGLLVWLDADIVTHAKVDRDWLEGLLPENADMGWLDRHGAYPETGFLIFRLPQSRPLIQRIADMYASGDVFALAEWHDAWVIQSVVKAAEKAGEITVASLSGDGRGCHHVFVNSELGTRLDHLKGRRKQQGRTPAHERMIAGGGKYWKR